jgi:4-amino-4-deoxy-L-arabinose transferase-like glycosyltransferase
MTGSPSRAVSRWEAVALALILLVAAVTRMGWPGLTEFKADEARLYSLAHHMAQGEFALRGISSSVGFPNFPMSVWLYSLPLALWRHPYAPTIFTGLLSTLAVFFCYRHARRWWGVPAALLAAMLFAVSPWAILYSRKIWAQNLLPLFVMGWGAAAALAFVGGKRPALALHLVCLAIAIQLHLAAAALLPATVIYLVVFRRRVDWRWLGLGVFGAVALALPFLWYLGSRAGPLTLPAGGTGRSGLSLRSLRYALMIHTGSDLHSLAGPEAFRDYLATVAGIAVVHWVWAAIIVVAVGWMAGYAWRHRRGASGQVGFIWLVWLACPILFFVWEWTPVYPHYLIAAFPAAYLIAGAFLQALLGRMGRSWQVATVAGVGLAAGLQLYALAALLVFAGARATPGGFGTPLSFKLEAADAARQLVESGKAAEVLIAGRGERPETDEFPAEFAALLAGTPHRFVDLGSTALFPAAAAAVILDESLNGPDRGAADLYKAAAGETLDVHLRQGEGLYRVLRLPEAAAPEPEVPIAEAPLLANFTRLLGSDRPRVRAGEAEWQVHWQTADHPEVADYHLFNHLIDATGARLSQADGPLFPASQWRAGDRVVSRTWMPWPDSLRPPLQMRVGMYRYPDLTPVPVLDAAANPAADAVEIPLSVDE